MPEGCSPTVFIYHLNRCQCPLLLEPAAGPQFSLPRLLLSALSSLTRTPSVFCVLFLLSRGEIKPCRRLVPEDTQLAVLTLLVRMASFHPETVVEPVDFLTCFEPIAGLPLLLCARLFPPLCAFSFF